MTYTLLLWITGCVGSDCMIPGYEVKAFDTLEECEVAANAWQGLDDKYVGMCLEGVVKPWEDVE